jgi:DNA-binding transcriptional regulator YhcF (GntR family)
MDSQEYLTKLINEKFPSVRNFAESIGVPYTTVRSILERGVGNAKVGNILKITEGLGITTDDLIKHQEDPDDVSKIAKVTQQLEPTRQHNVLNYAQAQLSEQNKKIAQINTVQEAPDDEDDSDELLAAHIDDDATPEERKAIMDWIDKTIRGKKD